MADVKKHVVVFNVDDTGAAGTVDVTIPGIGLPKAAICYTNNGQTDGVVEASGLLSIGITDGTNQRVYAGYMRDNDNPAFNGRADSNSSIIMVRADTQSPEAVGQWDFDSFIEDGIRFTVTTPFNDSPQIFPSVLCVLFTGSDIAEVDCNHTRMGTTNGETINITTPGFTPDLIFAINNLTTVGTTDWKENNYLSFGVAINDGSLTQRAIGHSAGNAEDPTDITAIISNDVLAHGMLGGGVQYDCTLTAFTATGFDIRTDGTGGGGSDDILHLCFRFTDNPQMALFDMAWPTSGDYTETNPGFEPDFGMIFTAGGVSSRNAADATGDKTISIAAFDRKAALGVVSISGQDNVSTSVAKSMTATDLDILDSDGAGSAVVASGWSFNSDGWEFTLTTNAPSSEWLGFGFAFGSGGGVGANFQANTIVTATPQTFDESPILGSPEDVAYLWTANPAGLIGNSFLFSGAGAGHAINLLAEGEFSFPSNLFDGQWLDGTSPDGNDTTDAALFNGIGAVILNITDGDTPTFTDKQSPGTTINNNVSVTLTNIEEFTEVRVYHAEDFTSPIDTTEIAGIEDTGSPSEFTFSAAAGTVVDIVVFNVDWILPPNNRIKNFTIPTTSTSFPISQILDRNFENP